MGNTPSRIGDRHQEEQQLYHTMAERLNERKQSGIVALMRWFARVLHKIAISAKISKTPTVVTYPRPRQRHIASVNTVDSIDDMRHAIAALGGWDDESDAMLSSVSLLTESVLLWSESHLTVAAARTESIGNPYRPTETRDTLGVDSRRTSDSSYSTITTIGPASIKLAQRATRTQLGILRVKSRETEEDIVTYTDYADGQEMVEDHKGSELLRQTGRSGHGTDSSRDTEIASLVMRRSFGVGIRRPPSPSYTV